jgi:hypothetical protein
LIEMPRSAITNDENLQQELPFSNRAKLAANKVLLPSYHRNLALQT